ncbi:MAG: hypothetical protein IPK58_17580 [Acidobacteria bacterium]|nr:hypothetical protein [Acidobacteriota bacterium]
MIRESELFDGRTLTKDVSDGGNTIPFSKGRNADEVRKLQGVELRHLRKADVSAETIDVAAEIKEYELRTSRQINI